MSTIETSAGPVAKESGIARYFELARYNVTFGSEIMAGATTFLVMAYIAFVNPRILTTVPDSTGFKLDFNATVTATCWVASLLCLLMGVFARRPFAMAPGMGLNAVVTFQLVAGQGLTWPQAMGIIVLEGIIITLLVLTKFRQAILDAVPMDLKRAIAAGIGLFILYIGLNEGGLVAGNPVYASDPTVPPVQLGNFGTVTILISVFGILLTAWMHVRKNRAAILIGILGATAFAIVLNYINMGLGNPPLYGNGIAQLPGMPVALPTMPYFFGLDLGAFSTAGPITSSLDTFSIMLSDFFDTMGTFVGVALLAGFLTKDGKLPEVEKPLLVDSVGPIVGGAFGASSATTYIESGAGVSAGGRTGIVAVTVGVLFLLVPFLTPIIGIVPPQATAAALIMVGFFMLQTLREVDWGNFREAFPVLITMIAMPLTYSITNGIGFGFILFVLMSFFTGAARKVHWLMYLSAAAFVLYFLSVPLRTWLGVS
ncbi:MAG: adenine/guanine/hypoxanthine permease [Chloroflexia bacterium]|jgi:AGZA family xanthine/uracil permease-like MFS transporter|nr:adenine/guanine/hypoxanthine permease [Chloroflexia bacterium]